MTGRKIDMSECYNARPAQWSTITKIVLPSDDPPDVVDRLTQRLAVFKGEWFKDGVATGVGAWAEYNAAKAFCAYLAGVTWGSSTWKRLRPVQRQALEDNPLWRREYLGHWVVQDDPYIEVPAGSKAALLEQWYKSWPAAKRPIVLSGTMHRTDLKEIARPYLMNHVGPNADDPTGQRLPHYAQPSPYKKAQQEAELVRLKAELDHTPWLDALPDLPLVGDPAAEKPVLNGVYTAKATTWSKPVPQLPWSPAEQAAALAVLSAPVKPRA